MIKFLNSDKDNFRYQIGETAYELPLFSEAIGGLGVERRAIKAGLDKKDVGNRVLIALQIALRDNEDAINAFEYLSMKEQLELVTKWADHSGAEPGE